LLKLAGVGFNSAYNFYEVKRRPHHNIHTFPSGVDQPHSPGGGSKKSVIRNPRYPSGAGR
jgi:hypothetical protein